MNKKELTGVVAESANMTKKDVSVVVDKVFDVISSALSRGEEVKISDFGVFKVKERAERKARNIHTGEEILVPASKAPHFKPARKLKDLLK